MKKKKKHIVLFSILGLIAIYNIVWLVYRFGIYGSFCKEVKYDDARGAYVEEQDNMSYQVHLPGYPRFKGNLYIGLAHPETEENPVDMVIWVNLLKQYKVGFIFGDENNQNEQFYLTLDENMELVNKEDKEAEYVRQRNMDTIKKYYQLANEKWGILK